MTKSKANRARRNASPTSQQWASILGLNSAGIRPAKNSGQREDSAPSETASLDDSQVSAASERYTKALRGIGHLGLSSAGADLWRIVLEPVSLEEVDAVIEAVRIVRKADNKT
jgi:hypothetical protein